MKTDLQIWRHRVPYRIIQILSRIKINFNSINKWCNNIMVDILICNKCLVWIKCLIKHFQVWMVFQQFLVYLVLLHQVWLINSFLNQFQMDLYFLTIIKWCHKSEVQICKQTQYLSFNNIMLSNNMPLIFKMLKVIWWWYIIKK
jgi:hypothetical protein